MVWCVCYAPVVVGALIGKPEELGSARVIEGGRGGGETWGMLCLWFLLIQETGQGCGVGFSGTQAEKGQSCAFFAPEKKENEEAGDRMIIDGGSMSCM